MNIVIVNGDLESLQKASELVFEMEGLVTLIIDNVEKIMAAALVVEAYILDLITELM